jgi:PfaD family protein
MMTTSSSSASSAFSTMCVWCPGSSAPAFEADGIAEVVHEVRDAVHVVREGEAGRVGAARGGELRPPVKPNGQGTRPFLHLGTLPPVYPEWLGDRSFGEVHGTRFAYVAGEMANGIATAEMVIAAGEAGMLGFFGAAGLGLREITRGIDSIAAALGDRAPWGANLIHAPSEPALEAATADLYVERGVLRVSASAFLELTPAVVRYAAAGLSTDASGSITRKHHVFAKISRPEVAAQFMAPAPKSMLDALVTEGKLTPREAALAARVPVAEDITVEADSGGHTDNRPLAVLFPLILDLRRTMLREHAYTRPIRIGAAGGLGTPAALASAFALGAAYVLTGSVNQGALEAGLSAEGKAMLAGAGFADVMMAPAADMFESGVKVQVLKRGTMFGPRASRLYDLYVRYGSLDELPADEKAKLEKDLFRAPVEEIWASTKSFFEEREPRQVARAERDPKHKMALVFRWYLGKSSRWAIDGTEGRRQDFQIWCGPAMGAFNEWVRGSFLERPEHRTTVQIAKNLLEGACVVTRAHQLRTYGVPVPDAAFRYVPRPIDPQHAAQA